MRRLRDMKEVFGVDSCAENPIWQMVIRPAGPVLSLGTNMDFPNPDLYPRITYPYGLIQIRINYYGYLQINGYIWINITKYFKFKNML